ncbi:hypothetical protein Lal_00033546 [Lupinus albus]|nr:hypothetical protein Lal_00033546 [Lupinus albus]
MTTKSNNHFTKEKSIKNKIAGTCVGVKPTQTHEKQEKKRKNIYLKVKTNTCEASRDETNNDSMHDMNVLVMKFSKLMKRNKNAKCVPTMKLNRSHEPSTSEQNFTYFECGKPFHTKMDDPTLKKNTFKGKLKKKTLIRAYIAQEDTDTSSN